MLSSGRGLFINFALYAVLSIAIVNFIYYISTVIDMKSDIYLFKALGEETKHRILKSLLKGELCACKIPHIIGKKQSNCSMHLAKLVNWGLIKHRREGKMILYSIKDKRAAHIFRLFEKND